MAIVYPSPPGTWSDAYGKQLHDRVMQYQADLYKRVEEAIKQARANKQPQLKPGQVGGMWTKPSQTAVVTPTIQNPVASPNNNSVPLPYVPNPNSQAANTSNLIQAVQNQNQPARNSSIQLPDIFSQNQNTSPNVFPPNSPQGIKMPTLSKNQGAGSNWSDLLSVAHNRYTR